MRLLLPGGTAYRLHVPANWNGTLLPIIGIPDDFAATTRPAWLKMLAAAQQTPADAPALRSLARAPRVTADPQARAWAMPGAAALAVAGEPGHFVPYQPAPFM